MSAWRITVDNAGPLCPRFTIDRDSAESTVRTLLQLRRAGVEPRNISIDKIPEKVS